MEPRQLRDRPRTHRRARIDIALDHRPEDVARTIVEFGDGRGRHPVHLGAAGSGWKKCSYSSSVIPAFAGMTRMIGSTLADHLADRQQIGLRSQRAAPKRVVSGKEVSVSVSLGGRGVIKTKSIQ